MTMVGGGPVLFDVLDSHIGLIRLNRPDARNAINVEAANALSELIDRTEADPDIRAVVLASAHPRMFSAGADLKVIAAGRVRDLRIGDAGLAGLIDSSRTKPWIAAVDGPALGGGFEMCLACDIIVATPDSRFGLPEIKRGLIAGGGGVHRVARVLPRNIALHLVATGEPIHAERAAHFGMVNEIVASADLIDRAVAIGKTIGESAPLAVRHSLALARAAADRSDVEMRRLSRDTMAYILATDDAREGARAFVEKRAPVWQGR